jgi:hypothetical protein
LLTELPASGVTGLMIHFLDPICHRMRDATEIITVEILNLMIIVPEYTLKEKLESIEKART